MREKHTKRLLEKVVTDYDNISDEFDQTRKSDWHEFETFLPYLIKKNQLIIDLGCGNGRFYEFLTKHLKPHYIGIDNNSKLLEKAHKNYPQAEFLKGDLLNIPIDDNSADVVAAIASFHHIPSKKLRHHALDEIHRILKKNGILILTVWNLYQPKYRKYVWKSYFRWLFSLSGYDIGDTFIPWGKTGTKRYYHAFKPHNLSTLLSTNGFAIIESSVGKNIVFICRKK